MADGLVVIAVEDSGPGLAPEELERVFERFYQVDKARPGGRGRGAGLGLAIAKEIVEAHQGEIHAYNNPQQGSVFVVKLPLAPEDGVKAQELPREFALPKTKSPGA